MADLLTHVLIVYVVGTIASWRYPRVRVYVPVGMAGAVIPDLAKFRLIIGADLVTEVTGVPFSWYPIHRLGGAVVIAAIGALCFRRRVSGRAFGVLLLGVASAFLIDASLVRASGVTPPYFYPISWWQPPSVGLYLSSDRWPAVASTVLAGTVWVIDSRRLDGSK